MLNYVTYYLILCYYTSRSLLDTPRKVNPQYQPEEDVMSKVLDRARPVIEATVISVLLVAAAVAVPVAIVYATV